MNNISGIYKITSPTGRIYIGQSTNIKKRVSYYKSLHCKGQTKIYASLKKHGWENHNFEILLHCDESKLNEMEAYYIDLYKSFDTEFGLNLTSGGDVVKCSEETKIKRSIALKGRVFTEEWKRKIGEKSRGRMIGFKHSEETLKKLKNIVRKKWTKPHPQKGKCVSKEEALIRHRLANKKYRLKIKEQKLKIKNECQE